MSHSMGRVLEIFEGNVPLLEFFGFYHLTVHANDTSNLHIYKTNTASIYVYVSSQFIYCKKDWPNAQQELQSRREKELPNN